MTKFSCRSTSSNSVKKYKCGIRADELVRLRKPLVIQDHRGNPTGKVNPAGEIWKVLLGSKQDPGIVWLSEPDGTSHTWDDDKKAFFEWFEIVKKARKSKKRST